MTCQLKQMIFSYCLFWTQFPLMPFSRNWVFEFKSFFYGPAGITHLLFSINSVSVIRMMNAPASNNKAGQATQIYVL